MYKRQYLIHRHGFLCATDGVTIGVGFQQSLGAGVFGGSGFILQKVAGAGTAWLELSGELIMKNLAPGEVLRVHPGHVGAFQASVGFQITMVPGLKNMIFGGDGIFLAVLQGPGTVWLQTLPISRLAHQIGEYLPRDVYKRQVAGRDYNAVEMGEPTLRQVYLKPYQAAVEAGAATMMSSFNSINGVPASANPFILTAVSYTHLDVYKRQV